VISNQNVLIYTTHINKVIATLYLFILRSKITEKQQQVRNFAWHRQRATCGSQAADWQTLFHKKLNGRMRRLCRI